ncbi:MAG: hypothetical protein WC712_05470, partial [Candidatus Brocadiia bacterium]
MNEAKCRHRWMVTNRRNGYLVVEGCFHCGGRISFFTEEPRPPVDDYREGDHFWGYMGSYQATKFDLTCEECYETVELNDVMALMLCMNCNPDCELAKLAKADKNKRAWVYVALCADTSHAGGKCVSPQGIAALNEYFNQGSRDQ